MLQTVAVGHAAPATTARAATSIGILVKLKDAEQLSLREILDLTLTNADGEPVVLRNVVAVQPRSGPVRIERKDQERVVTVSRQHHRPRHGLDPRRHPRRTALRARAPRLHASSSAATTRSSRRPSGNCC